MSKILVVEDSVEVLSNIIKILMLNGYTSISAGDGREGFEVARREIPDLIVADIMMPEYDGYTMLNKLRTDPNTEHIPVIFLSAKVDRIEIRKGMAAGADDYITKPFRAKDLIDSIETQLRKKKKVEDTLNELYNNISSYIPHELRTPLVAIFGYTDLMLSDLENLRKEEMKSMLSSIRKTADGLYNTLEKFLLYSETEVMLKDQANYKELKDNYMSSPEWIIQELISKTDYPGKILFNNLTHMDEMEIKIFPDHFKTIVEEILTNAVKFSSSDADIKVVVKNTNGSYSFSVTNTGRGMTTAEIAKISPFIQHGRSVFEQKGNGLGLAIVKRLCKFYDASFNIQSQPDDITKVEIVFPAKIAVTEGIAI